MIRAGVRRFFQLALRRRDRWERDVEDEITLHLSLRAEQLAAQGSAPGDAYREAVRRFGPLTESRAKLVEAARHREERMSRTEYVDDLRQDISFALRTLARQKGWTTVTILTMALGIGATTAVFSVVSALLLHAVPYPNGDRVVNIYQQPSQGNSTGIDVTISPNAPVIRVWMQNAHSFEAIEPTTLGPRMLKTVDEPSRIMTATVLPTFLSFAGERPILGRMFSASDIESGGHVALLGEAMWRTRFGADPSVIGKQITLNDSLYQIVGVAPASLRFTGAQVRPIDAWLPFDIRNDKLGASLLGRLRPGAAIPVAMRELDSLYARSAGFTDGKIPFRAVVVRPAQRVRFHDSLIVLTWAVAFVLLVACANVAHLLIARSVTRRRELAIRAALGAGQGRVLRQLLTESLVLSLSGTAVGVVLGWAGLRGMVALRPQSLESLRVAHLDAATLAVAIVVALLAGTAFALIGVFQSSRHSTHDTLKSSAVSTSRSRGDGRARALLVISEMALSGTLLVGATLLLRSVINMQNADLGFKPDGLYSVSAHLADSGIPLYGLTTPAARLAFLREFTARVRRLPGVQSVAVASVSPGSRSFSIGQLEIEGEPAPATARTAFIDVNEVEPNYFRTMGIRIEQGGTFTDTTSTSNQVIINSGFARAHWGGVSPLGKRLRVAGDGRPWLTIVGVAAEAQTGGPADASTAPFLYSPATDFRYPEILIRTTAGAESLAGLIPLAKSMGITRSVEIESVEGVIAKSIAAPRFVMLLLSIFTGLAVVLAGIGLYGVMSYTVTQHTREIGIRVALGASGNRIARGVIGRGTALAAFGAVIGLLAAVWTTKLIEGQLHGVARLDPLAFVAGGFVLIATAAIACIVPTRRALAVDPMTAIRAD